MKTLLIVNPLNSGKLPEYKKFVAEITGPRKNEYKDMLKRHQFKSSEVWHQKIDEKEYLVLYHEMEGDPKDPLVSWTSSTHPFDTWFKEQLNNFHGFSSIESAEMVFRFKVD